MRKQWIYTRRSSLIFQAPGYEARYVSELIQKQDLGYPMSVKNSPVACKQKNFNENIIVRDVTAGCSGCQR